MQGMINLTVEPTEAVNASDWHALAFLVTNRRWVHQKYLSWVKRGLRKLNDECVHHIVCLLLDHLWVFSKKVIRPSERTIPMVEPPTALPNAISCQCINTEDPRADVTWYFQRTKPLKYLPQMPTMMSLYARRLRLFFLAGDTSVFYSCCEKMFVGRRELVSVCRSRLLKWRTAQRVHAKDPLYRKRAPFFLSHLERASRAMGAVIWTESDNKRRTSRNHGNKQSVF